jgi:hypothetical protein
MVHLYHFLINLHANRYKNQGDTIKGNLAKLKYTSTGGVHYQTIQETLSETFVLEKLLDNNISDQIEGIVEYSVQEMSDEDMEILARDYNITHDENVEIKPQESIIEIEPQESNGMPDDLGTDPASIEEQGQAQGIEICKL